MTLSDFFSTIAGISGLVVRCNQHAGDGFSFSVQQITQPLRNVRLVVLALLANFVLVPLIALAITRLIPLDQSLQIGVILFGCAPGRPHP